MPAAPVFWRSPGFQSGLGHAKGFRRATAEDAAANAAAATGGDAAGMVGGGRKQAAEEIVSAGFLTGFAVRSVFGL